MLSREDDEELFRQTKEYRYDLYRVPFNGGKGGTAEPLRGASGNGRSNYFPKYSPDGRWIVAATSQPDEEYTVATKAFAIDGSETASICIRYCLVRWDTTGKFVFLYLPRPTKGTYLLAASESGLPNVPAGGVTKQQDVEKEKLAPAISYFVDSAVGSTLYAYTRQTTHRNLYRIPLQ